MLPLCDLCAKPFFVSELIAGRCINCKLAFDDGYQAALKEQNAVTHQQAIDRRDLRIAQLETQLDQAIKQAELEAESYIAALKANDKWRAKVDQLEAQLSKPIEDYRVKDILNRISYQAQAMGDHGMNGVAGTLESAANLIKDLQKQVEHLTNRLEHSSFCSSQSGSVSECHICKPKEDTLENLLKRQKEAMDSGDFENAPIKPL